MADLSYPRHEVVETTPRRRSQADIFGWLNCWVVTVDHKKLGILYMIYSIFFLLVGGVEAIAIRIQLIQPDMHFISPQVYNRLFTMHGVTMVFLVGMTYIFGFANYLIPLMIGARDMAFPRLNAFSFWMTFLVECFSITASSGEAASMGWATLRM